MRVFLSDYNAYMAEEKESAWLGQKCSCYQKWAYRIAVACCDNRLTSFDEMFPGNG